MLVHFGGMDWNLQFSHRLGLFWENLSNQNCSKNFELYEEKILSDLLNS